MIAKCHCQHCNGAIEFEAEALENDALAKGEKQTCPSCGNQTTLYLPANRLRVVPGQANGIIVLVYCLAVLIPIFGFFGSIYLMATKQPGHGVCAMGLSVLVSVLAFLAWFRF